MDDDKEVPPFQTPDEQRRMTSDLMKRLLGAIDQWGKAQGRKHVTQMRDITLDALLKTITAICVQKELSSVGVSPMNVNLLLQRIYREEPIEAEEPEMLLALRARKDVLFRNLKRELSALFENRTPPGQPHLTGGMAHTPQPTNGTEHDVHGVG